MKQILLIILILIAGCSVQPAQEINFETIEVYDVNLTADKDLYHSGEVIHLEAKVDIPDATVKFYGIHSKRNRLDQTVELVNGLAVLDYNAPRCNSCSGIREGIYQITADVYSNEEKIGTKTIDIEIKQ